ncbi:MAG: hypothetical protein IKL72_06105 [Firmicutes bacterium]|nr:hypothetical protein [Bacillota bacterium]
MEKVNVRSRMGEEDFKNFLYYNQYFFEKNYIAVRVAVSIIIGAAAAFFSSDKVSTFLVIAAACLLVFIIFPWGKIRFNYQRIYRRNRSTAFSQSQDFEFTSEYFGFKSEHEDEYTYEPYSNLLKAAETKTLFAISFTKKQTVVLVKEYAEEDEIKAVSRMLRNGMGDRFVQISRI